MEDAVAAEGDVDEVARIVNGDDVGAVSPGVSGVRGEIDLEAKQ